MCPLARQKCSLFCVEPKISFGLHEKVSPTWEKSYLLVSHSSSFFFRLIQLTLANSKKKKKSRDKLVGLKKKKKKKLYSKTA